MPGSIGVAVRKAVMDGLETRFAALAAFNGTTAPERKTEVSYGYPFNSKAAEQIYTGRSFGTTPPAALRPGRNYRDERGTFELNVLVRYLGGDAEQADLRLEDICDVLEEWLADRKSNELGVTGLLTLTVTGWRGDYMGMDQGHAALRTYTVEWTARLT